MPTKLSEVNTLERIVHYENKKEVKMDIKRYFKQLNKNAETMDKKAKNPFLEHDFAYNPFMGAIEQTYIWIEKAKKR